MASAACHVWTVSPEALGDRGTLDACRAMLCEDERARMARFRFAGDRHAYLVAHALVRTALSSCAPSVAPAAWRFCTNAHGRPEVDAPCEAPRLRFNLSHAEGLVACVVTEGADCGIDVENVDRRANVDALAGRVLSPGERARLHSQPPEHRRTRFFRYWTLKEAYVKARGVGLSLSLSRCAFDLDGAAIDLSLDPALDDDPARWQFAQWMEGPRHVLALALRRGGAGELRIVHHAGPPAPLRTTD